MSSKSSAAAGPCVNCIMMATETKNCDFKPRRFDRRPVGDYDVLIDMKYCGICHSDLHAAAGHVEMFMKGWPFVAGHELAGVVQAVGSKVTKVKLGDHVGVGCMVDSCLTCAACKRGEEQMCSKQVGTYGSQDKSGRAAYAPSAPQHTLGGYTDKFVVHEHFAVIIPKAYPLECAGPVLCAGVTLFDPLRRYGAGPGVNVAIVGIGGLGQMGVKIAKAMGCVVTAVTRSASKAKFAKEIGADAVLVSSSALEMKAAAGQFDLIMNTIPIEHDFYAYKPLLKPRGKMVMLGLNTGLIAGFAVDAIVCGASKIKGSGIGGIEATQAVIDLCAKHDIKPEIKVIPVSEINHAYEILDSSNESGVRHVIDIAGSLNETAFEACKDIPPPKLGPQPTPLGAGAIIGAILKMLCCCRWR